MLTVVSSTLLFVLFTLVLAVSILLARRALIPDSTVIVTINGEQKINGHYGQKLLQALSEQSVHLPSACAGAGTCGLCRVRVGRGISPATPVEKALLSHSDIANGQRLACQMNLRSAVDIDVPQEMLATRSWHAEIVSTRSLSPLIREIRLKPESIPFEFEPGDFMQITAPAGEVYLADIEPDEPHEKAWYSMAMEHLGVRWSSPVMRAYSLANTAEDTDVVTLMIRLALPPSNAVESIPPGVVSSWLFTRRPGDYVELSGPHKGFNIRDEQRELVFVGGGVGMAPLRAMIHRQIGRKHEFPMTFFYGARGQDDLLYRDEFDALSAANNGFSWIDALSEPEADWQGERGFIHDVFRERFINSHHAPETCDYYLCGPPLMVKATVEVLRKAGVRDTQIYKDEFG